MKLKLYLVTLLLFIGVGIYGLCERAGHKDLNGKDNTDIDNFYVGILTADTLSAQIDVMNKNLEDSSYIIEVVCVEGMKYRFSCASQRVEVKKVFKGDDIRPGDAIDILRITRIFHSVALLPGFALNMGFSNEMKAGESYLVFLDRKIETYDDLNLYAQADIYFINPVFSYADHEQDFHDSEVEKSNSVRYSTVKNDEFFLMSQEAVDELKAFKEALLLKYPQ